MDAFQLVEILLFPGLTFFVWLAFVFDWLDRKTAARMQGRIGPLLAGPHGILQPVADFFKLTAKEEIVPQFADKLVFEWGPPLFFAAPAIGSIFIPVTGLNAIVSDPFDLLLILFVLAFSTLMAALLGYASSGRYSTIAMGRLVIQYTGFEVPLIISIVTPAILARSLSVSGIVAAQSHYWYILLAPISFAVFIIAALAELEKAPFDIPSAKTEIVAGWMTEFSGRSLAYVKLTKNLSYVFLSALAASLFLGGPSGPVLTPTPVLQSVLFLIYFLVKLFVVGFVIFALRTALARVRIEQATKIFWTILTPLSLLQMGLVILLR
ncbi:MAG: NADH-quinone oxidoreductase subunit H [Thaumarchaeota archaeon]|nr:NADH-quinone oxidoreductase subunit H [Nitrososphaerota archaeon]MDG6907017.1 NADH-quinone oxidoreductase subunit H [Nitrososphaerota archaeon]